MTQPILYSFIRCPYAIRARMALLNSHIAFILREVDLKNKPQELLTVSPKGTVPVLIKPDGNIIDESVDIVRHVFSHDKSLINTHCSDILPSLMEQLQNDVIPALTHYKYPDRYPDADIEADAHCLQQYLGHLETTLAKPKTTGTSTLSEAEIMIFPFVRQYYKVNMEAFDQLPLSQLQNWLHQIIDSTLFQKVMTKVEPWHSEQADVILQ